MEKALTRAKGNPRVFAIAARFELDCGRRDAVNKLLTRMREAAGNEKRYKDLISAYHLKSEG